jgi:hypothetical protein
MEFFKSNYDWIFSGIGSGLLFWLLGLKQGYKKAIIQNMRIGNQSTGIQVGHNIKGNIDKK